MASTTTDTDGGLTTCAAARLLIRAQHVGRCGVHTASGGNFLRVFDRFTQQDAGMAREHGGLGLGLAIVRHLAEMHGGTVCVVSTEGQGATFTIALPVADAA